MKKYIITYVLLGFLSSCAKVVPPTGGDRDQIPPRLLQVFPKPYTTDYQGQTIQFLFNEPIETKGLKQEMTISPNYDLLYKSKIKDKSLIITFLDTIPSNRTYLVNLGGAVRDLTEGNASPNPGALFSTGPSLDTIRLTGHLTDYYTGEPIIDGTALLYKASVDSIDIDQIGNALYSAKTDSGGHYIFYNLPQDTFRLYGLAEKKANRRYDNPEERIAFLSDSLFIDRSTEIDLQVKSYNTAPPKIGKPQVTGQIATIELNKEVEQYTIHSELPSAIYTRWNGLNLEFFYTDTLPTDSIRLDLSVTDQYNQMDRDTFQIVFNPERIQDDRRRKRTVFPQPEFKVTFSGETSLRPKQIDDLVIKSTLPLKPLVLDSIQIVTAAEDTVPLASDQYTTDRIYDSANYYIVLPDLLDLQYTKLIFKKGAIQSIMGDTLEAKQINLTPLQVEDYGTIEGILIAPDRQYKIQLLSDQYNVEQELDWTQVRKVRNTTIFKFTYVTPGTKYIRVLVDKDRDGIYQEGNFLTREPPEPVYIYPEPISIKANWEILRDDLKITLPTDL